MIEFTEEMRLQNEQCFLGRTSYFPNPLCGTQGRGTPTRSLQTGQLTQPSRKYILPRCAPGLDECGFKCPCKNFCKESLNQPKLYDQTSELKRPAFYIKKPVSGVATKLTEIVTLRARRSEFFETMYYNIRLHADTGKSASKKLAQIAASKSQSDSVEIVISKLKAHYEWLQKVPAVDRSWRASTVHNSNRLLIQQNSDESVTIAISNGSACSLQRKYPPVEKDRSWRRYQTRQSSRLLMENFTDGGSSLHLPALSHFFIPFVNPPTNFSRNNL